SPPYHLVPLSLHDALPIFDGLLAGTLGFGGEESAGASFLRRDGTVWTTDKDGLIMGLLAAEMTARTGRDPGELYRDLAARYGTRSEEHTSELQSRGHLVCR